MPAARLLIGPLLRRVVGTRATVWVETSAPAVVSVRAAGGASGTAPTFSAYDHHYALVVVEGLAPDSAASYEVLIDDEMAWPVPESGFPPSVIRTRAADDRDQPVKLIFGSCRETTQHATTRRLPPDALDAYARRLIAAPEPAARPDLLVLLGDQVYADITSPTVKRLLKRRRRRPRNAPTDQVVEDNILALGNRQRPPLAVEPEGDVPGRDDRRLSGPSAVRPQNVQPQGNRDQSSS